MITSFGSHRIHHKYHLTDCRIAVRAAAIILMACAVSPQASAQDFSAQYYLNFYDYWQPDPLQPSIAPYTVYQGVGGGFVPNPSPPGWGSNPTTAQLQAFGNTTTVTAEQNGQILHPTYENSSGVPYEYATEYIPKVSQRGSWNFTIQNQTYGYSSSNLSTYSIPADIPAAIPFVSNMQVTGTTPTNEIISWTNPKFTVPSDAITATNFLIANMKTGDIEAVFILPANTTSFDLSQLGHVNDSDGIPRKALTPGIDYQITVANSLRSLDGAHLYSNSRNYTDFSPTTAPSGVSGPIYLPTVSINGPGNVTYGFNMNVTAGVSYNIDPAAARGFIYDIGAGDPNFASVELPDIGNSNPYEVLLWNGTKFVFDAFLEPNTLFDFSTGGVSEFEIFGIDPNANVGLLNANAFITTVTFAGTGTFTGTMTSVVPEPSTWAMMVIGFVGIGFVGYRRSRKLTPSRIFRGSPLPSN
jgi:hypothetical protein